MIEMLREHIEKIISLSDAEFELISRHFVQQDYAKKEFLFRQGQRVTYNYFVLQGLLKLVYNDDAGTEHIVSFAMEDWWESDYQAFYKRSAATMSLQCIEDSSVLCITVDNYNKLCKALPKIEHFLLAKANGGHIASQQRILSFLTSSAKDRYEQLLHRYPSLFQRVPKTQIASFLGVSRETLSRLHK